MFGIYEVQPFVGFRWLSFAFVLVSLHIVSRQTGPERFVVGGKGKHESVMLVLHAFMWAIFIPSELNFHSAHKLVISTRRAA